jgi:hypothetical protein
MVNVDHINWDVMLLTTLWAYPTTYKVTTKHITSYGLYDETKPMLPSKFIIPTYRTIGS